MNINKLIIACAICLMGTMFLACSSNKSESSKSNIHNTSIIEMCSNLPYCLAWNEGHAPTEAHLKKLQDSIGPDSVAAIIYVAASCPVNWYDSTNYWSMHVHDSMALHCYKKMVMRLPESSKASLKKVVFNKRYENVFFVQIFFPDSLQNFIVNGKFQNKGMLLDYLHLMWDPAILTTVAPYLSDSMIAKAEMGRYVSHKRLLQVAEGQKPIDGFLTIANTRFSDTSKDHYVEAIRFLTRRVGEIPDDEAYLVRTAFKWDYITERQAQNLESIRQKVRKTKGK